MLEFLGESYFEGEIHRGAFLYGKKALKEFAEMKIIIWGTGSAAGRVTDKLLLGGVRPYAYCDNDRRRWGKHFYGRPILSPEEAYGTGEEDRYFILTVTGKNLDFVTEQVMIRYGENWSCFFERQIGDYFDTPELLGIVINSINDVMKRNAFRKNLKWHQCVRSSLIYENIDLIIMSTKFWDNFIRYLYEKDDKSYRMLDIGPGYGTFSLIYSHICTGEVN